MTTKQTFKDLRALLKEWERQTEGKDIQDIYYDLYRIAGQIQSEIDSIHHERITRANELLLKLNL
jgi:hypothetical protein